MIELQKPESDIPGQGQIRSAGFGRSIPVEDRRILRKLALQVAELAARPSEQDKRDLWYQHNALEPTRPLIFCDPENSWNEIIPSDQLTCRNHLARSWEKDLRKEIYWGTQLRDDRVIEPFINIVHQYSESGWGMQEIKIGGDNGGAYTWHSPLQNYEQMEKLRFRQIIVDQAATNLVLEMANEIMGDLLTVRLKTVWYWTMGLTWELIKLRGLQQVMYDMMDHPNELHHLMAFLRDGHMAKLDYLEHNGYLSHNNDGSYVGSGGFGWTKELPQSDHTDLVRLQDTWGFAESQETVGISPDMFEEFIFPYQLPLLERFGLNCYGCCEPLDNRWHIIERLPRLRRISVAPWANRAFMAEQLTDRYVFSMKPNPADLAMDTIDEERIRVDLRRDLRATRDCRVELIMKDTHTIRKDPQRVVRWVQIAREEAENL